MIVEITFSHHKLRNITIIPLKTFNGALFVIMESSKSESDFDDRPVSATIPSTESTAKFDVGDVLVGYVKELGPQDKYNYLKNHFVPKQNQVISQEVVKGTVKKKKRLTFQLFWLDTYKWLAYSPRFNGGLCKFCILFPPTTGQVASGTFLTTPFKHLKKAGGTKEKLQTHANLKYHRDSAACVQAFISTFRKPETSIQHCVSKQARMRYELTVTILS